MASHVWRILSWGRKSIDALPLKPSRLPGQCQALSQPNNGSIQQAEIYIQLLQIWAALAFTGQDWEGQKFRRAVVFMPTQQLFETLHPGSPLMMNMKGARERPGSGVLNLGDRAPVGVGAPPPNRPLDNPQEKGPAFRVRYV
ncbi:unnamed protein product [Pleuronectes platessa]|uniref:Uncharacterized protein n=1 Tax=Pleuronectes platessa TaxID=8262 RepID=A0A9N7V8V5_PLEPL|nr:unnamed protein product [Pleuronectes platessa]